MSKQYFNAFVIGSDRLHGGALHLAFRVDNEDYYFKKFKRTSHTCHHIELPWGMTKEAARAWILEEFPENEIYKQACAFNTSKQSKPLAGLPETSKDRLEAIRQRILKHKANVDQLEQEEQDVLALLDVYGE